MCLLVNSFTNNNNNNNDDRVTCVAMVTNTFSCMGVSLYNPKGLCKNIELLWLTGTL